MTERGDWTADDQRRLELFAAAALAGLLGRGDNGEQVKLTAYDYAQQLAYHFKKQEEKKSV